MKANGKAPITIEAATLDKDEQQLDEILDAVVEAPVRPVSKIRYNHQGRPYAYYKSLCERGLWAEWWDDFNSSVDPKTGKTKYRTAYQFAQAKANGAEQRKWIMEMIGPRPDLDDTGLKKLRLPWLGDWEKVRANGFWAFEDPSKTKAIAQAVKERQDQKLAVLALAPLCYQQISRAVRAHQKVDEIFGGQLYMDSLSPTDPKNLRRMKAYVNAHSLVDKKLLAPWLQRYFEIHGFDPNWAGHQWANMAGMAGQVGAAAALTGVAAAGGALEDQPPAAQLTGLPEGITVQDVVMASIMNSHREMYGTEIPEKLDPQKAMERAVEKDKESSRRTH